MAKKMSIKAEGSALVVIDMQKDFCYEDGALFMGDTVEKTNWRICYYYELR